MCLQMYTKKLRIGCTNLFVLSTLNALRPIKLKFSEDICYNHISKFREKQLVLSDETLIFELINIFDKLNTNL